MPKPLLRRSLPGLISKLPLRAILIIPFVVQILLVAGLIGFLSFQNGHKAVSSLATQLESEMGRRVVQTLETYLKMPQLANQINADAVQQGLLNLDDPALLRQYLWNQFRQFNDQYLSESTGDKAQQPDDISLLAIATQQGNYVDVGYYQKNGRLTMSTRNRQNGSLEIWRLNQWGTPLSPPDNLLDKVPHYNPRVRPWYRTAVQEGRLVWVGPYHTVGDNDYVISAAQPLFDGQGNILGVTDATLSLRDVSQFLSSLRIGQAGQIFIMKLNGELLATSTRDSSAVESQQALDSSNPLIRETARYLQQQFGNFDQINYRQQQQPQQLEFCNSQGKKQFVRLESFRKQQYLGLDWLVVITVPEDDFMAQIRANTLLTALLCLLGLLGAIIFGIAAGRWLTKPIVQLSRAADGLARGDWDRPVTIRRSGELNLLVNAFNHMRQELKQSQEQLEEYSRGLEQKNEQLQTLEAELRRQLNLFLHAVSHDLRNPVLGTAMVLDHLSTQSGDEIKLSRPILERMQESNQRQLALINSLIDTHAAEIWGITLQPRPLALKPIVDSAIADLLPMLEKAQTHLDNRIPVDLPLVEIDPLQLARVYQNLLANAFKHNPAGLRISLDARIADPQSGTSTGDVKAGVPPTLDPVQKSGWIYCTVTDDGIGISPDQCQRLFDPYYRGESKSRSVGLGLGLYLCRQIIQAHGGEIGVSSQPRMGTMFWFTLPISHAPVGKALPSDQVSANTIS